MQVFFFWKDDAQHFSSQCGLLVRCQGVSSCGVVTTHELMSLIHRPVSDVLHNCYELAAVTTRGQGYKKAGSHFSSGRHPYKVCPCDYSVYYFRVLISWICLPA